MHYFLTLVSCCFTLGRWSRAKNMKYFGAKKGSPARGLAWPGSDSGQSEWNSLSKIQLKDKKAVRERWSLVSFAAVFRLVTQRSSPQTAAFFRTTCLSRIWPIRIWYTYRKSVRGIGKRPITARVLYVPSKWLLSTMKVFSFSWLLNLKYFLWTRTRREL